MGILQRLLSFEKPMGDTLTRLLYYLAVLAIIWLGLKQLWFWLTYFDNDWDTALWGLIKTPFIVVLQILAVRVMAELVLAVFRMDRSLHDQVTGRVAPPKVD